MQLRHSVKFEYQTRRLILKVLTFDYAHDVLNFQNRNRSLFEAYEPKRPNNFYTLSYQQSILKCEWNLALKQQCIRFYVFCKEDPFTIIGTVCLHDIRFSPYSCTEIGYKFDAAFHHKGYAAEAIRESLEIAFSNLMLHRVFARVMPENHASIHLLESVGFEYEGIERECFRIRGSWADHLRYAYVNPHTYG